MNSELLVNLQQDVRSWNEVVVKIKQCDNELQEGEEKTAFYTLADQWRNSYDPEICVELAKIIAKYFKYHTANTTLIENLKEFRRLCGIYYTKDPELFREFSKALKINNQGSAVPPPGRQPAVDDGNPIKVTNFQLPHGGRYTGELLSGSPHGRGFCIYPNGEKYEGEWVEGTWTGRGVFTDTSGRIDRGEYRNGSRVGQGRMDWLSGDRYEGGWNDHGFHGRGTYYASDKSKYTGEFVDGRREGRGVLTDSRGNKFDCVFKNNEQISFAPQGGNSTRTVSSGTNPVRTPSRETRTTPSREISPATPSISSSTSSSGTRVPSGTSGTRGRGKFVLGCILGLFMLLLIGGIGYVYWYIPYKTDKDAPRTYVFATNLFLRSGKVADVEYNRIGKIPYGSELITYSRGEDGWAEVKADGKKGYVSSAFVLDSTDFHLLNGVWGNADAKEAIPTAKCRLAVLDYLKKHNLQSGELGWQIFTKPLEIKPNSVMYPRLQNGYNNFTDFAFILKNNQSQERSLVLYSFQEDETPVLMFTEQAPADGDIRNITYRSGRWGGYAVTYTKGLASSVTNTRPQAQTRTETSPQTPVSVPVKVNTPSIESTPVKEEASPKEKAGADNPSGVTITNVVFANANYNGTTITDYGGALYSDLRYLQPKITYKTTKPDRVALMIKIITPKSVLLQGSSSPSDGTFTQSIPASTSSIPQTYILMGWGGVEGTVYVPGKYIYEIWSKGHLLYRTNFTVLAR